MPLLGQSVGGYTGLGVKVDHVDLCEGDGSKGILTITLRNPNTDTITLQSGGSGPAPVPAAGQAGDSLPGLRWQPFRRRIESHPLCGTNSAAGTNSADGTNSRATSDDGHIPKASYTLVPGGWTYDQYQSLLKAGETEYDEPQPILTLETEWYAKPATFGGKNYQIDTPPTDQGLTLPVPINGGGDWVWVRGGDSLVRQNKRWHLDQSWTGYRPGTELTNYQLLFGTPDTGDGGGGSGGGDGGSGGGGGGDTGGGGSGGGGGGDTGGGGSGGGGGGDTGGGGSGGS